MTSQIVERHESMPVAAVDDSAAMLQIIQSMATNPACDIEKLERLMQLKERMDAKQAEAEFNAALSRVQGGMGRVEADATNSQTRSQYATYGKLDKAVRPIYSREGFSLSFSTEAAPEGFVGMVCFVSHSAGHTREYRALVPSDGKGAKGGDVMTKTHAFGSGTSYGMRYLLKMIFNIAIGEEDDDGNAASGQDLRNAAMDDLLQRVKDTATPDDLTKVWQSGVKVLRAARDSEGYEEFKSAVSVRGKQLEESA